MEAVERAPHTAQGRIISLAVSADTFQSGTAAGAFLRESFRIDSGR
jgi:hypothetical protein